VGEAVVMVVVVFAVNEHPSVVTQVIDVAVAVVLPVLSTEYVKNVEQSVTLAATQDVVDCVCCEAGSLLLSVGVGSF
jgi:hypothetical protein